MYAYTMICVLSWVEVHSAHLLIFFPILMLMFECLLEYFVGVGWYELHAAGTTPVLLDSKMYFATAVV